MARTDLDIVWRDPDHAGQSRRFTQRVAGDSGDSGDFVCCARATGLACSDPTRLADNVNTGGIGSGPGSATSIYLDASEHTKTRQYRRTRRAGYESYRRK
jgi:hypothetical protein